MAPRKPKADTSPRPKPTPAAPKKKPAAKKASTTNKPTVKKATVKKYCSVKVEMHHPFQRVRIPVNPPGIMLERDNWLDTQIGAGFVREL